MQDFDIAIIWLIGGILLMLLEILLPGGIVFFLGLGATLVALLLYSGVIDGWLQAFTVWFIGSLVLLFGLRGVVQKIVPAVVNRGRTDEDLDAYNQLASVCERIPADGEGRINFRGSTWPARSYQASLDIEAGTQVRIAFRDNLVWLVEPVDLENDPGQDQPSSPL